MDKQELIKYLREQAYYHPIVHHATKCIIAKYYEQEKYTVADIVDKHFEEFMGLLVPALLAQNKELFDMNLKREMLSVRPMIVHIDNLPKNSPYRSPNGDITIPIGDPPPEMMQKLQESVVENLKQNISRGNLR